jgi:hypothetical protein
MQIEKKDIRAVSQRTINFVTSGDKAFVAIKFMNGYGVREHTVLRI